MSQCIKLHPRTPLRPGERQARVAVVSSSLSIRLDHLFSANRRRGGQEPTYREVAAAISARGGPTVSPSYIWQLRTGLKANPTLKHLEALAGYFGVEPAYFFDDATAERVDADLALSAAMQDPGVRAVALAAAELSPDSLAMVLAVIDRTRALEQNVGPRHATPSTPAKPSRKRTLKATAGNDAAPDPS